MPLTIAYQANARVVDHGLNVYPLQGFGILLGRVSRDGEDYDVLAALPVGNTEHWYASPGRFDRIDAALTLATDAFADWQLRPVGLYCSVYWHWDSGDTDTGDVLATAPRRPDAQWLLLRSVDGGESIFAPRVWHLDADGWQEDEDWKTTRGRPASAARNPHRIRTAWNHAWGMLDYSNHHETELPRLGLAPVNVSQGNDQGNRNVGIARNGRLSRVLARKPSGNDTYRFKTHSTDAKQEGKAKSSTP